MTHPPAGDPGGRQTKAPCNYQLMTKQWPLHDSPCRLVTLEGAALVERQTKALFGDLRTLQSEMQNAVGQDAMSMEELMQRVQQVR